MVGSAQMRSLLRRTPNWPTGSCACYCNRVDKGVIEINEEGTFVDQGSENGVCHALECNTSIRQAEQHAGELE